jgi:hypothetical protein
LEIIKSKEKFKIESSEKAIFYQEQTIKVNNLDGLKKLRVFWIYTPQIELSKFKASVQYQGKLKEYTIKDLGDQSLAELNYQLFSDLRVKYLPLENQLKFPILINYVIESKFKGFLSIPPFFPAYDYNIEVQDASYEIEFPTNYQFQRSFSSFNGIIDSSTNTKNKTLRFNVSQFKGVPNECYQLPIDLLGPKIQLIPAQATFDGYRFQLTNWDDIAKWTQLLLNQSNGKLSPQTIAQIDLLKSKFKGKVLAQKIYEFMQSRVRYVGIQLGIGGFKPNSPEWTDKYGYGDCKALSYYYVKLLEQAGIKGYYTLIHTREFKPHSEPKFNGLGSFNHAVVCIPLEGDTLIAECTSQSAKFNENNYFTGGQYGLLISDGKGYWYRFPEPSIKQIGSSYNLLIPEDGKIEINKQPLSSYGNWSKHIYLFENKLILGEFTLSNKIDCSLKGRETPVFIQDTIVMVDTLRIENKKLIARKSLPNNKHYQNKLGTFSSLIHSEATKVIWIVKIQLYSGVFLKEDYVYLINLLEEVNTTKMEELEIQYEK